MLEDSAGGQVSVHLNGTVLEDPLTYGNTSVADNHCFPIHINKTGLPDQTSVASVRVNGPAPVYLYRIRSVVAVFSYFRFLSLYMQLHTFHQSGHDCARGAFRIRPRAHERLASKLCER